MKLQSLFESFAGYVRGHRYIGTVRWAGSADEVVVKAVDMDGDGRFVERRVSCGDLARVSTADRLESLVAEFEFAAGELDAHRAVTEPVKTDDVACVAPIDWLYVEYDGVTLRDLLVWDQARRRETHPQWRSLTPVQRAAISAHWSAELRRKVEAAKQKEREQVVNEYDHDA